MEEKLVIEDPESYFGPLYPLVANDAITDIDFNGSSLWTTDCLNRHEPAEICLTDGFVGQFTKRVSNTVSRPFHKMSPVLEAQTDTLRITVVHESAAVSGRSFCIRKSLPVVRLTEEKMRKEGYCDREVLDLLTACVRAKCNIVCAGEPGVGKTELIKFLSGYIPEEERVITIEDNPELHYRQLYPDRDCVELQVLPQFDYSLAIKTCLRLNPKWMMLSEARSKEVVHLIEAYSTGIRGMTTIHTDDVRKIPDRMINMAGGSRDADRFENDVYSFVDLGILIVRREIEGQVRRRIEQVAWFERKEGVNRTLLLVDDGKRTGEALPEKLRDFLREEGGTEEIPADGPPEENPETILSMSDAMRLIEERDAIRLTGEEGANAFRGRNSYGGTYLGAGKAE